MSNRKLPERFAERLLELELNIGIQKEKASITDIKELLSVYADAIEYYSSISIETYADLNSRMQSFLIQPHILKVLEKKAESTKYKKRRATIRNGEGPLIHPLVAATIESEKGSRRSSFHATGHRPSFGSSFNPESGSENATEESDESDDDTSSISSAIEIEGITQEVEYLLTDEVVLSGRKASISVGQEVSDIMEKSQASKIEAVKQDLINQEESLIEKLKQRRQKKKFPLGVESKSATKSSFMNTSLTEKEKGIDLEGYAVTLVLTPTRSKKIEFPQNIQNPEIVLTPRKGNHAVLPVEDDEEARKKVWSVCYSNYNAFSQKLEEELEAFMEKSLQIKHDELEKIQQKYEALFQQNSGNETSCMDLENSKAQEIKELTTKLDEEKKAGIQKIKDALNKSRDEELSKQKEQIVQKFSVVETNTL